MFFIKKQLIKCISFIFVSLISISITSCSGNEQENSIWGRGAKFVKIQSSENYLKNEDPVFLSMNEKHTASAWVEYFFSVYSTRNWITEDDEYAQYTKGPVLPSGIKLCKFVKSDTLTTPQLVVKADDDNSKIIVEGYGSPGKGMVFKDQWEFPKFDN